ncbi:hypothetical protein HMPREF1576_01008 [Gardnerella pickettii JCP7719]|uniref:Restriction endonuclease type II-like domain-containing protein n=1 Tax=Gardnerella pickettii JCP7719 TaxID=1261061 RepID=S4GLM4_9BIFI|nr:hypothetical protein HMPREF1576_01008 [Gardnerella pickettii JCP7719]
MGFWERRHHIKEARSLLRVGAKVDDLHEALKIVAAQAAQWRTFVPHGGWPVLPPKLDEIVSTQELLDRNLVALNAVLSTTRLGADLENIEFTKLDERLQALHDSRESLDTLPGRCVIERELRGVGLEDLVCDLRRRKVTGQALDGELHLAWWTTVFEDIVNSSEIISNQDGSALQDASDRFVQVDTEHVRSVGPMVQQEALKKLCDLLFARSQEANQLHTALASNGSGVTFAKLMNSYPDLLLAAKPILVAMPSTLTMMTEFKPIVDVVIIDSAEHINNIELLSILARARQAVVIAHKQTVSSQSVSDLISVLPTICVKSRATRRSTYLADFLENHGYGLLRHDVPVEKMQGKVKLHQVEAAGVPVMATGLIESSQREIDEVVSLIKQRAKTFSIVPSSYVLAVVTLTSVFRNRLGAELKALAVKDENMGRFLRHVRLVSVNEAVGAAATDVILSLCYAKTSHGRLLQQFGVLEEEGGKSMLLDSLALARRNLDIVCAFKSSDMEDDRLHQDGPKLLKDLLIWAEALDDNPVDAAAAGDSSDAVDAGDEGSEVEPTKSQAAGDFSANGFSNVLFADLAERIRSRGLNVAVNYGFSEDHSIPLVVGLPNKPFALAVLTDDARFMSIESTRERNRVLAQDLEYLGWSVMNVWSVGAFVNPEKEVERIVSRIGELYKSGEQQ